MKFYNREKEIAELVRIRELAFVQNSRMVVLKGNLLFVNSRKGYFCCLRTANAYICSLKLKYKNVWRRYLPSRTVY